MAVPRSEDTHHEGKPESAAWIEAVRRDPRTSVWNILVGRYQSRLMALATLVLGPNALRFVSAEDLVQEAWLAVTRSLSEFEYRGEGSLCALLATHVRRLAADWGRKGSLRAREQPVHGEGSLVSLEGGESPSVGPRELERAAQIVRSLSDSRLPRTYAAVLVAVYLEEVPLPEYAQARGLTAASAHTLVSRARQRFRELFVQDLAEMV